MQTDYPYDPKTSPPDPSQPPRYVSDVKFIEIPIDTIPVPTEWQLGDDTYSFGMQCKKPPPQPFDGAPRVTRLWVEKHPYDFNVAREGKQVQVCVTYTINSRFAIADIDFVANKEACGNEA